MEVLEIDKTCRTCGSQATNSDFFPLFKTEERKQNSIQTVPGEILQLLGALNLNFKPDDDLPQRMCFECLTTLAAIKEYQQHCEDVQEALNTYFSNEYCSNKFENEYQIDEMAQNDVRNTHDTVYSIETSTQTTTSLESRNNADATVASSFKVTETLEVFDDCHDNHASNNSAKDYNLATCKASGNLCNSENAVLTPRQQGQKHELDMQPGNDSDTKAGGRVNSYFIFDNNTTNSLPVEKCTSSETIVRFVIDLDTFHQQSNEQSKIGSACADEKMAVCFPVEDYNELAKITTDSLNVHESNVSSVDKSSEEEEITENDTWNCEFFINEKKKKAVTNNGSKTKRRQVTKNEECPFCHSMFVKASVHMPKCSMRDVEICPYCNAFIKTPEELKDHIDQLHPEGFFQCEICSGAFDTHAKRLEHVRKMHNDPICRICDQKFSSAGALQRHNKRWHIDAGRYDCTICKKTMVTAYSLEKHLLRHVRDRSFKCKYCQKGFTQACQLRAHERIHTGERPFLCDICGRGFRTNDMRKTHRLVHTGDETPNFICDICDATFQVKERYLFHKIKHATNQIPATKRRKIKKRKPRNYSPKENKVMKRHVCPICDKDFRSLFALDIHVKKHKEVRPFACDRCGDRFKRMEHLRSHIERLHSNLEKAIPCEVCGRKFLKRFDLNAHSKLHTGVKSIKCRYCPATFRWSSARKDHEISHTGDKPYVCFVCNEAYSFLPELQKHYENHSQAELDDGERKVLEGLAEREDQNETITQSPETSEEQIITDVMEELTAVESISLESEINPCC